MAMTPETPALTILYRDECLLAVAKPAGLDVFGAPGGREETLCARLLAQFPALAGVGDPRQPAIVHRLDRGTSGLLLVARDNRTYTSMRSAFASRAISKGYLALVEGLLEAPVEIDRPIGARYRRSHKVRVSHDPSRLRSVRPAKTWVKPLQTAFGFTLCRVHIDTGVRHQIRAHLAHLGHPVVGDTLYGGKAVVPELRGRFFLHAYFAGFSHPARTSLLALTCPLPGELEAALAALGVASVRITAESWA